MNIVEQSPRQSFGDYSTILTLPEVNNCLSIILRLLSERKGYLTGQLLHMSVFRAILAHPTEK